MSLFAVSGLTLISKKHDWGMIFYLFSESAVYLYSFGTFRDRARSGNKVGLPSSLGTVKI